MEACIVIKKHYDVVVLGAGIIGLSIARIFSRHNKSVLLVEKQTDYGQGISSSNSQTIHAGIYYEPDTLKAKLCLDGMKLLYEYLDKNNLPYRKCGKLFADFDQSPDAVNKLLERGISNGVPGLRVLGKTELAELEPALSVDHAILSPETGIFCAKSFMRCVFNENLSLGVDFTPSSNVIGSDHNRGSWHLNIMMPDSSIKKVATPLVINAAGITAAKSIFPDQPVPQLYPLYGSYFQYQGKNPFTHIIYPILEPGNPVPRIDAFMDVKNQLFFGPTVDNEWVNPAQGDSLVSQYIGAIKRYLPSIKDQELSFVIGGCRPRIYDKGERPKDFYIRFDGMRWLNLFGMESPALTSALAIANYCYALSTE